MPPPRLAPERRTDETALTESPMENSSSIPLESQSEMGDPRPQLRISDLELVDRRERLVNDSLVGTIEQTSLPLDLITSVHGILLDFDPDRLHPDLAPISVLGNPDLLHRQIVRPWLDRNSVLSRAEVRSSGRGLHVIVRMYPPVRFESEAERQRWAAVAKIIQNILPTDPDCSGITAMTRPLDSINSKNGRPVVLLHAGQPVGPEEVLALWKEACHHPFAFVAGLLYPGARISPCPVCRGEGSRLDILNDHGKCYGRCGKVRLSKLFDLHLTSRPAAKQRYTHGFATG